jgi:hypothetical protein
MAEPGTVLAGYVLEERIGAGGMAEVFRAVRVGPGAFAKPVALKRVLPQLAEDPELVRLFFEEARLSARLASPNLVQVFDFGEAGGVHYLVMEYVHGLDLATLLARRGPLPLPLAFFVARQLLSGLSDLHGALDEEGAPLRAVHRDVNPGNLLLSTAGDVKLGDFGIAKARARSGQTDRGAIRGKLAYLSPEQARGDELDARADLYAVGLLLFEVLTGRRYLDAEGEVELLRLAAEPRPRAPSSLRPELPAWPDELLARALAPEPGRRYPSARHFDDAIAARVAADPAQLRRTLGELVAEARGGPRCAEEKAPPSGPPAIGPAARSAAEAQHPRTQLLVVDAGHRSSIGRLARWPLLLLGAASVGVAAFLFLGQGPAEVRGPSLTPRPSQAMKDSALPLASIPPADGSPSPALPDASVEAAATARAPGARTPGLARPRHPSAISAVETAPDAGRRRDATRPPPRAPRPGGALLDEVDRVLAEKGVLPDDAPDLRQAQRALAAARARGEEVEEPARLLLERCRRLSVDRAFVEAKLKRIDRRIAASHLEAALAERIRGRTRVALSHAVTGRYTEANRELNAIVGLLPR